MRGRCRGVYSALYSSFSYSNLYSMRHMAAMPDVGVPDMVAAHMALRDPHGHRERCHATEGCHSGPHQVRKGAHRLHHLQSGMARCGSTARPFYSVFYSL